MIFRGALKKGGDDDEKNQSMDLRSLVRFLSVGMPSENLGGSQG